jgi:hypothetical protein
MELKQRIENLLLEEKKRFPKAEIQDFYKLIFQSVFGAGHLIKDSTSAIDYLTEEWNQIEGNKEVDWSCDISLTVPMLRLNLAKCKAENVPLLEIADLFFEGCQRFANPLQISFTEILQLMCNVLTKSPFDFCENKLSDQLPMDQQTNFPILHHSVVYRELYKPHYRVIPLKYRRLKF